MATIRVSPSRLRESATELEKTSAAIEEALSLVELAVNKAPSYEGQFGPTVQTLGAEATTRAHKCSSALSDLSDGLQVKADAFETADRAGADGISGIGQHLFVIKTGGPLFEIPDWIKELIIGFLPLGDLYDIGKELLRLIREGETDELVLALAVLGLIADLGWLDGFIPDPLDAANAAMAALKTLVKGVPPGPARDAIKEVVQGLIRNTDEVPRYFEALHEVLKHEDILKALGENPNALAAIMEAGPEVMELLGKNSEVALELLSHGDDALALIKNTEALELLLRRGPEVVGRIAQYGDEGASLIARYKDEMVDFLVHTPDDVGDLAHRTTKALEAAERLAEVGMHSDEASELIATIARNSTQGSGNRVVLGEWIGRSDGYIGEVLENGGIYYESAPGIYDAIKLEGDALWQVNEQFLRDQMKAGIEQIDFVSGDVMEWVSRFPHRASGRELNFLLTHGDEFGYKLVGNSWIRIDLVP